MSYLPTIIRTGTPRRVRPSGYVHLWQPGYVQKFADGTLVVLSVCGRVYSEDDLTTVYPPKAKHCIACFPNGIPAPPLLNHV